MIFYGVVVILRVAAEIGHKIIGFPGGVDEPYALTVAGIEEHDITFERCVGGTVGGYVYERPLVIGEDVIQAEFTTGAPVIHLVMIAQVFAAVGDKRVEINIVEGKYAVHGKGCKSDLRRCCHLNRDPEPHMIELIETIHGKNDK